MLEFIQKNITCKVLTFCYCNSLYFHNMDVNHLYNFDEESIDLTVNQKRSEVVSLKKN